MRVYTCIIALFVPSLINIILNIVIFTYVRSCSRRVQPQIVSTLTNTNNHQEPKVSRRDISLFRQIIFMFSVFIGGWSPLHLVLIITQFIYVDPLIFRLVVVFGELSILCIIINLLKYNRELKQYFVNKFRQYGQ